MPLGVGVVWSNMPFNISFKTHPVTSQLQIGAFVYESHKGRRRQQLGEVVAVHCHPFPIKTAIRGSSACFRYFRQCTYGHISSTSRILVYSIASKRFMQGSSCSPRCRPLHNKEAAAINDTTSAVELITNLADNQGLLSLVRWLKHKLLEHCGVANCMEDEILKSIGGHKEFDWANGASFVRHMLNKQAIHWEQDLCQNRDMVNNTREFSDRAGKPFHFLASKRVQRHSIGIQHYLDIPNTEWTIIYNLLSMKILILSLDTSYMENENPCLACQRWEAISFPCFEKSSCAPIQTVRTLKLKVIYGCEIGDVLVWEIQIWTLGLLFRSQQCNICGVVDIPSVQEVSKGCTIAPLTKAAIKRLYLQDGHEVATCFNECQMSRLRRHVWCTVFGDPKPVANLVHMGF
ncbi:hypothetical protein SELMODRAFT_420142 [Selaginella moellendorffii]|uniref:Uncharacterized protein n=1 Tax=Selaginella moellendorffii TaxID=88036 RepID=D8SB37_SELML|nr:hypothetical protein SELMODRAFT_420142 [Selaginella moellendorffii]